MRHQEEGGHGNSLIGPWKVMKKSWTLFPSKCRALCDIMCDIMWYQKLCDIMTTEWMKKTLWSIFIWKKMIVHLDASSPTKYPKHWRNFQKFWLTVCFSGGNTNIKEYICMKIGCIWQLILDYQQCSSYLPLDGYVQSWLEFSTTCF